MKSFKIHRPTQVEDAFALLPSGRGPAEFDEARPMAGGQDLLTEMQEHLIEPATSLRSTTDSGSSRCSCT